MRACAILNVNGIGHCWPDSHLEASHVLPDTSQEAPTSHWRLRRHQRIRIFSGSLHEPRQKLFFDFVSKQGEIQTPLRNLNLNAQRSTSYDKSSYVRPEHALELFVESLNRNNLDDHLICLDLWAHFPLENGVKSICAHLNADVLDIVRC